MPLTLPKAPTPKKNDLRSLTVLLHGGKKIGKSSFCAGMPNVVFAATEPGLGQLEVHQAPIQSWQDFIDFCNALVEEKHGFQTVVIDTINNLYAFACRAVCEKHKVEYVGDFKAIGKGHVLANNMFYETMLKLANLPFGVWMIAHSVEKEIETRTEKYLKSVPQLPDKAAGQILGMADLILYADLHEERDENDKPHFRRVLRTKPSKYFEAGDRSGLLPTIIDLDYGKFAEAYTTAVTAQKAGQPQPASRANQPAAPKAGDEKPPAGQKTPAAAQGK
ncbi:MAG TPA: ATP-binding protein [bacterium]|nr:ATP-binding protein [bacterium]